MLELVSYFTDVHRLCGGFAAAGAEVQFRTAMLQDCRDVEIVPLLLRFLC